MPNGGSEQPTVQPGGTSTPPASKRAARETILRWGFLTAFAFAVSFSLSAFIDRIAKLPYSAVETHTLLSIPIFFVLIPWLIQRHVRTKNGERLPMGTLVWTTILAVLAFGVVWAILTAISNAL